METKRCFRCDKIKPLDAFNVNRLKYQLRNSKGYATTCKKCMIKHTSADMKGMIYNFDTGKFEVKYFKTKKEIREHYEQRQGTRLQQSESRTMAQCNTPTNGTCN